MLANLEMKFIKFNSDEGMIEKSPNPRTPIYKQIKS